MLDHCCLKKSLAGVCRLPSTHCFRAFCAFLLGSYFFTVPPPKSLLDPRPGRVFLHGFVFLGKPVYPTLTFLWFQFNKCLWKASGVLRAGDTELIKTVLSGLPLWCSGLRIQCCHCSGSGRCYGVGLILGLGTSTCPRSSQKKKKKKRQCFVCFFFQGFNSNSVRRQMYKYLLINPMS